MSFVQLRVFGAPPPPKVAQPVAERPVVSSTPPPAVAAPTHDNLEDAAPAEPSEGQLNVLCAFSGLKSWMQLNFYFLFYLFLTAVLLGYVLLYLLIYQIIVYPNFLIMIFCDAADGRSVYVKNLPMSITAAELEGEFQKFGPVKPSGVNVKSQKVIVIRLLIRRI